MILVYKRHSTAGSQTGLRLDRWVAWHDLGRCTTIWAKDASWNERKSQAEKSTRRETDRYTILVYANHAEVAHTTIVVFLVVATITATIDSGFCGSFSSFWLKLCEKKWVTFSIAHAHVLSVSENAQISHDIFFK